MPSLSSLAECSSRGGWLALAGLAAITLPACQGPGHELFPLNPGTSWTYRTVTESGEAGEREESRLVLRALEPETLPDGRRASHRRSEDGMDWWLLTDAGGIQRVASKSDSDPEIQIDAPGRYVLKNPLSVGTEWRASTAAYLLKRPQQYPPELRHAHRDITMSYRIEATDEVVETPAGHFSGCLRVEGRATLRLYIDPVNGWGDVPLETTEWYCPGPGLVKLRRVEPGRTSFLVGGRYLMELIEWHAS